MKNHIFALFFCASIISCASVEQPRGINEAATQGLLKLAQSEMNKVFDKSPIFLDPNERIQTAILPGPTFNPKKSFKNPIRFNNSGNIILLPGDYIIPVMTYCMNSSGESPSGYSYAINKIVGSRAAMLRKINLRALPKFDAGDIQILSWSIQNGLSFDEMTSQSQKIIEAVIPEFKSDLKDSILKKIANRWNQLSDKSHGLILNFDQVSDDFLDSLGDSGKAIVRFRNFHNLLREKGNDFQSLRIALITSSGSYQKSATNSWSRLSDKVYIRFLTSGSFQNVGQVQIRILSSTASRSTSSSNSEVQIDLMSLLADPIDIRIQPLSFSTLLSLEGAVLVPIEIANAPMIVAALIAAVLAEEVINWESFFKLADINQGANDPTVNQLLQQGRNTLGEEKDNLEKPARDVGVIDKGTKDTSNRKNGETRNYEKAGGDEALKKDFDKFPGEATTSDDGKVETKVLPNGTRIVMRPNTTTSKIPTLEIQPPENNKNSNVKIKVRY